MRGRGRQVLLCAWCAGLFFGTASSAAQNPPDGPNIVYRTNAGTYAVNADGSGLKDLPTILASVDAAMWTPDGDRIVLVSARDSVGRELSYDLYVMNHDGSNLTRLTTGALSIQNPSMSPDGTRIVFDSEREGGWSEIEYDIGGGWSEIYVANVDGSGFVNITNNDYDDGGPCWSPDSEKIVYSSHRDGYGAIYVSNADGSNETRWGFGLSCGTDAQDG